MLAVAAVVAVGAGALWANSQRSINRVFFSASLHVALWLTFVNWAMMSVDGLIWIKLSCMLGALIPGHLWTLKECIVQPKEPAAGFRRSMPFLAAGLALALLVPTRFFVPIGSTAETPLRGLGYYVFIIGLVVLFSLLVRSGVKQARAASGVAKIELQILLLGGSAAALAILLAMAVRGVFQARVGYPLHSFLVMSVYAATVVAITTHRIFDARYIIFLAVQRLLLVTGVAGTVYLLYSVSVLFLPPLLSFVATVAVGLWFATRFDLWLDGMIGRYPQATKARAAALAVGRRARKFDDMIRDLEAVLKGWGGVEHSIILFSPGERFTGAGIELATDDPVVQLLQELKWVTPERLAREKLNHRREHLAQFMGARQLGAVVFVRGPTLSIIAGVGIRPSRKPFTYPDVLQLMELSAIMESSLAQVHLSVKAQRAEQLATVGVLGAGVAHEIRNPLVTIKSFVHLLPHHYNDANFRERFFKLITDEVGRIDRLTEQLLDLASPRTYSAVPISLHESVQGALSLLGSRAAEGGVEIRSELSVKSDTILTDPNALRQVLLNLCLNAVQAQETSKRPRWIAIKSRCLDRGIELSIADNGLGIPTAQRAQLFQAFHTTKSSGFGLGLAVCSEILSGLDASITVDPFVEGEGAVFRIVFPCPPPIS